MSDPTRPLFEHSITEMIEIVQQGDAELTQFVREELSFRKPTPKVRKLAQELRCATKLPASNRSQVPAPSPVERESMANTLAAAVSQVSLVGGVL